MRNEDIQLTLDLPSDRRTFAPGDTVLGTLRVDAQKVVQVQALSVGLRWQTRGKGNAREERAAEQRMGRVVADPGASRSFPFELVLPERVPTTYAGTLLEVAWTVEAEAVIEWALDGEVSVPVEVLPRESRRLEVQRGDVKSNNRVGVVVAAAVSLLVMTSCMALEYVRTYIVVSAFVAVVAVALLIARLQRVALSRRWYTGADITVALAAEDRGYRDGGTRDVLECRVPTHGRVPLAAGTATLRVREVVTRGSGDSRQTEDHELYRSSAPLAQEGTDWTARLELPGGEVPPFSVEIVDNRLAWEVVFDLDIPSWPDTQHVLSLDVHPAPPGPPM